MYTGLMRRLLCSRDLGPEWLGTGGRWGRGGVQRVSNWLQTEYPTQARGNCVRARKPVRAPLSSKESRLGIELRAKLLAQHAWCPGLNSQYSTTEQKTDKDLRFGVKVLWGPWGEQNP